MVIKIQMIIHLSVFFIVMENLIYVLHDKYIHRYIKVTEFMSVCLFILKDLANRYCSLLQCSFSSAHVLGKFISH